MTKMWNGGRLTSLVWGRCSDGRPDWWV